eukprot:TRINITY_DN778_c0_g2_i1.p1 TRINITY_DN778_c0_g2~~TRINITY_DN778_c0_g2_i1.p1  ORF type:complete len:938 (+),score=231.05 TRINITY_DN778_c0_g2_i1:208-3021(+)
MAPFAYRFLTVILVVQYASQIHAAVFTMDYGSESIKVAVVNPRPGQAPIDIAINEMSKRKSPALVALSAGERLLSEEAAGIIARYPERVYSYVRDMVGVPSEAVGPFLKENYLPYKVVSDPDRGTVRIETHDSSAEHTAEELVAMIFGYARDLAETHAKQGVKDAVVSVPPHFRQPQRQAILDAGQIAGVNVMALVHEHSGVAIQYGFDKDFSNGSRNVIFYDMGARGCWAALVQYSSYTAKERGGKNMTHNQFQVKAIRWDATLGGQTFESRLVEYFADEFNAKSGLKVDVRNYPKAMAKLKKQVKRTKEVLSANQEAPIFADSLIEDIDFRSSVTREKFEELSEDLWERALEPLKGVLADAAELAGDNPGSPAAGVAAQLAKVDAVELVGGGTRVPKLQATLASFLGEQRTLDRHLDADEALALGSALLAANLSDGFKLNRKIGMMDGLPYGVLFQIHQQGEIEEDEQMLFPRLKKMPSKVLRSLKSPTVDLTVELLYEDQGATGVSDRQIAKYQVAGVANASVKYSSYNLTSPLRTSLHFSLSRSGLVALDSAETVVEFSEWIEVPVEVIKENSTLFSNGTSSNNSTSNSTTQDEGSGADGGSEDEGAGGDEAGVGAKDGEEKEEASGGKGEEGEGAADEEAAAPAVIMKRKLRKRTIRIPLKLTDISEGIARPMPLAEIDAAKERLKKLAEKERAKREVAEAKNSLEAYIYATKDKLESEEGLERVSTKKERSELDKKLAEAEEWLEEDGDTASAADFRKKQAGLKEAGAKMELRLTEITARPAAIEEASSFSETARETVEGWEKSKPWINETDRAEVISQVEALDKWIAEKQALQKKQKLTDDPVLTSSEIQAKVVIIKDQVARLNRISKPRPKPPPKEPASKKNDTSKATEDEGQPSDASGEGKGSETGSGAEGGGAAPDEAGSGEHDELK